MTTSGDILTNRRGGRRIVVSQQGTIILLCPCAAIRLESTLSRIAELSGREVFVQRLPVFD
jgi:hypothetical protein